MLLGGFTIFYFHTFRPNYNLDLRSYGQLLSLFKVMFNLSLYDWAVVVALYTGIGEIFFSTVVTVVV